MNDSTLGKIVGGWQVSGLFVAQSGQALTIGGNGTLLNTPGNTAFVNLTGENKVLGGLGPGTAVLRSDGLLAAGRGRAGQHEAAYRSRRSGLLAARWRRSSSGSGSAARATANSASTPTT